jgi:hypothetical protein
MTPEQKMQKRARAIIADRSDASGNARGWGMLALTIIAYSAIILLS